MKETNPSATSKLAVSSGRALLLPGRGEVHGFGFGWGVALADVHEQAELLQVVVQVVGAGDHVFAGVEENGTVVCEE